MSDYDEYDDDEFFICLDCEENGSTRELGDGAYCPHCESDNIITTDEAGYDRFQQTGEWRDPEDLEDLEESRIAKKKVNRKITEKEILESILDGTINIKEAKLLHQEAFGSKRN